MEETLKKFNDLYIDLKILAEYEIELRTKGKNMADATQDEKDMLDADKASLFMLIQEKVELIKDLESKILSLEYYEEGGIYNNSKIEELIKGEREIIRFIYEDNNGLDRFFEATVLNREEYDELNAEIGKLERASKKLQPKIQGSQKSFKQQALRAEGFIEASNGKLIHPSIIDEYEKLLALKAKLDKKYKDTYSLKQKYDELLTSVKSIAPSLTPDQIAEIINRKIEKVISDEEEKKTQEKDVDIDEEELSIEDLEKKLKENKDKKDLGKWLGILSELIRKRLSLIDEDYFKNLKTELETRGYSKDQVENLTMADLENVIKNNPLDKDILKLLMDYLNSKQVKETNESPIIIDDELKKLALKAYDESGYGRNVYGHYFNIWKDEYDPDYKPWEDDIYINAAKKIKNGDEKENVISDELKMKALRAYDESGYGRNVYGHYFNVWTDEYDPDYKPWEDEIYLAAARTDNRPIKTELVEEKNTNISEDKPADKEEEGIYFGKGKNDIFEPKTFEHEVKEAKERLKPTVDDLDLKRIIDGINSEKVKLHLAFNPELSVDEAVMFLANEEYKKAKTSDVEEIINNLSDDELDGFEQIGDDEKAELDDNNKKFEIKDKKKSPGKAREAIKSALSSLMNKGIFKAIKNFVKRKKEQSNKQIIDEIQENNEMESGYSM